MDEKNNSYEVLYTPSKWCKRLEPNSVVNNHIETVQLMSEKIKTSKLCKTTNLNIRYGPGERQLLDIYEDSLICSDYTFVFIHGGYWQELNKDISAYCVEPLVNVGIRVVVPGYDLAPTVTLSNIVEEIKQLLIYLKTNLKYKNIWLGGHSAGAHLAASMIHPSVHDEFGVNGFILISGVYKLDPLLKTTINKALNLNEYSCLKLSPMSNLSKLDFSRPSCIRILVVSAENDSPAFHHQSSEFTKLLDELGLDVTEERINGVDHFNIVENLSNKNYYLTERIIYLILNNTY